MKFPNGKFWDIVGENIEKSPNPLIRGEVISEKSHHVEYYVIGISESGFVFVIPTEYGITSDYKGKFVQYGQQKNIYSITVQEFKKLEGYVEYYEKPLRLNVMEKLNKALTIELLTLSQEA